MMNPGMKAVSRLLPAAALLVIAVACSQQSEMRPPGLPKPVPAPEITLKDLAGKPVSISDFRGKPLIVNFWATWCVPCREEMPTLEKLYNERKQRGFEIILINAKESKQVVEKFLKKNGYTFRVLLDETGEAYRQFQVFGLPTTLFIDKESVIQYSYIGQLRSAVLKMGMQTISLK